MSIPAIHERMTLHQWVQFNVIDAHDEFNFAVNHGLPSSMFMDEIQEYQLWANQDIQVQVDFFAAAQLDLIASNTEGLFDQIAAAGEAQVDATLAATLDLKNFLSGEFLAAVTSGAMDLEGPLAEIREALNRNVAGSIGSLDATVDLIGARSLIADGLQIGATKEGAQLIANVLGAGLAALAEASRGGGGQDFEEWLKGVTPHSAANPTGNVVTTENVSPFLKMGSAAFGFLIEKTGIMLADILGAVFKASDALSPAFKPLIDTVIDQVEERANNLGEVTPGDGFPLARKFIDEAFRNGLKARIISILLEKAGDQVKNLGIQQIAGLVGDLSGFSQLAEAVHGTQLKAAVARPVEYQINAATRTRLLSPGELVEAAVERKISLEEMRQILRYHGYTEHHIDIIQATMWQDPRLREIVLLASDVSVSDDDVRHWLSEAGYEDGDIERIAPVVVQQSNRGHRQALTSEVMANLGEGFLEEEDAEAQFDRLRYTEEAKRLLLDTGRLKFRREVIQAHITELESMFQLEQIQEPEFRLGLAGLGVRKEKIDAIVGKAVSKFTGRVSKEEDRQVDADVRAFQSASLAALRAQFSAGLITGEGFFANLVAVGFLSQIAREIVALEQIKALTKQAGERDDEADRLREEIRRARMAAFVDLFRDGLLSSDALRANLLALGLAAELADAIVFRELAIQEEAPKQS